MCGFRSSVITDHRSMTIIARFQISVVSDIRWILVLVRFRFSVVFRKLADMIFDRFRVWVDAGSRSFPIIGCCRSSVDFDIRTFPIIGLIVGEFRPSVVTDRRSFQLPIVPYNTFPMTSRSRLLITADHRSFPIIAGKSEARRYAPRHTPATVFMATTGTTLGSRHCYDTVVLNLVILTLDKAPEHCPRRPC